MRGDPMRRECAPHVPVDGAVADSACRSDSLAGCRLRGGIRTAFAATTGAWHPDQELAAAVVVRVGRATESSFSR